MAESLADKLENLLSRLAGTTEAAGGESTWAAVDAGRPDHDPDAGSPPTAMAPNLAAEQKLEGLLERINSISSRESTNDAPPSEPPSDQAARPEAPVAIGESPRPPTVENDTVDAFLPTEPTSFREAGLTDSEVEALVLKYLLARGDAAGRTIADQVSMPFLIVEELLVQLKSDQILAHKYAAPMNDYVYQLTDMGRARARHYNQYCTYFGSAPVDLNDYVESVRQQSLEQQEPSTDDLQAAFHDLFVNARMLNRLGPAINSGRGMFLYGKPGNGKTSIAERITAAFGQIIWIPRAIGVDGEIIRMYDPNHHEEIPLQKEGGLYQSSRIDHRWVRVRRPTIIVGGELRMSNLEVTLNTSTGISEAPLQLKANCGTLLIDDFGRQQMSVDELLNRWIVPLEKRYDFLNLANGKKIKVPFDELIVFATNLERKDLVDEAFLRRIPYKIEIGDPSEEEFHHLFQLCCCQLGCDYRDEVVEYLLTNHYRAVGRALRRCHPRDLLTQIRNDCTYRDVDFEMKPEYFDHVVASYFAMVLGQGD